MRAIKRIFNKQKPAAWVINLADRTRKCNKPRRQVKSEQKVRNALIGCASLSEKENIDIKQKGQDMRETKY